MIFLVFTQSQETQKTIATLVSQRKEIIKIILLRVNYHGRHDVTAGLFKGGLYLTLGKAKITSAFTFLGKRLQFL